jgi:hypothetical protein
MNFDKLYQQYDSYWKTHDLGKAINSLQAISGYLGSDWTLLSPSTALKPENLLSRYAYDRNYSVNEYQKVADTVSYSALLKSYSMYLDSLIKEIVDYDLKLKAMKEKSFFDSLIEAIGSFASASLGLLIPVAIAFLILYAFKD